LHWVDRQVEDATDPLGIVGASTGIQRVRTAIKRVVDLAVPVLIRGESGTGRELVAYAIHDKSSRRSGPFVTVNLGAIPPELAAVELFGSTRGAYAGASRDRIGLFRTADGGTLFLDEVGETPLEVQAMLLRVLETGEIYPIGSERPRAIQVRLIAAANVDLEEQIRRSQFKAPLLHRLAGFEVRLPPLRERRDDIGLLFHHFAREELEALGEGHRLSQDPYARPWLPAHVAAQLVRYAWPGNIRELHNVARQLVIESRGLNHVRLDPRLANQLGMVARPSNSGPLRLPSGPAIEVPQPAPDPAIVPALTIVSHPATHRAGERLLLHTIAAGSEAILSSDAPDFTRPDRALGQPLGDLFVSPIRFAPGADGGVRVLVDRRGTLVVDGAPVDGSAEFTADDLAHGVALELADRVVLLLHWADRQVEDAADPLGMVGASAAIRQVRTAIERVVNLTVPVLIRGETGTGKELVARAIHDKSPHRNGPFVTVNLGAIPREIAAAELFGWVRGAFAGASRDRDGLFRAAHGGTLFLDEVGEAPPEVQVMLLRVLETGQIRPIGADRPVAIQVRLIAAANADLEEQIQRGQFKAPLLHRLAGFEIRLPPLRERRDDIGPLFYHFAREELEALGEGHRLSPQGSDARPWLPAHVAAQLVRYAWPGNIRELRNVTRQLVIESRGLDQVRLDPRLANQLGMVARPSTSGPLRLPSGSAIDVPQRASNPAIETRRKPSDVTESELQDTLRACAWDLKVAADRLRISRSSICGLVARSPHIRTAGDLGTDEIAQCFRSCAGELDAMVAQLQVSRRALSRRLRKLGLASR
ncbi:MAG TPA: sigma 54-interacting transcriptional regulator, partial [Kofleriaceae bacterium]|nr:sigma 54-interacting transcriptional regulator [Kofleriaceae bacterium]